MAGFQFLLHLVVVLYVSLEAVSALQCHTCSYSKFGNEETGNKHCEKPKGDLGKIILQGCNGGGGTGTTSVFGCGKVAVRDGKRSSDNSALTYSVDRRCVSSLTLAANVNEGCSEKSVSEWAMGTDEWSRWVSGRTGSFSADTRVEACYCTKDECNGAPTLTLSLALLGIAVLSAIGKCIL